MNVEIGTEAAQFPEKEYINGIFLAVRVTVCCTVPCLQYYTVYRINIHSHILIIELLYFSSLSSWLFSPSPLTRWTVGWYFCSAESNNRMLPHFSRRVAQKREWWMALAMIAMLFSLPQPSSKIDFVEEKKQRRRQKRFCFSNLTYSVRPSVKYYIVDSSVSEWQTVLLN
jgi:hypothetical protein